MNDELETGWQDSLSEDLQGNETLKGITTVSGMAKMLVSAEGMVGKDKVVVPGEDASQEELDSFHNKMGRPEKDDGYELTLPEGLKYSDEDMKSFRVAAHKMGLSATHAKALFDWHTSLSVEGAKTSSLKQKEALRTVEETLKKEWGAAYDQKKELALRAIRTFADADAFVALEEGLGNDPRLVKLFNKVGEAISEDKLKGSVPIYTPGENQDAINKIMSDLKHPYHDKKNPGHVAAVEHVQKLYGALYPEE
jgi:uncharacterized protein YpuA (DUF1002 family)